MRQQEVLEVEVLWSDRGYLCIEDPAPFCTLPDIEILPKKEPPSLLPLFALHGPMSIDEIRTYLPDHTAQRVRLRVCQLVRRGKLIVSSRQQTVAKLKKTIYALPVK